MDRFGAKRSARSGGAQVRGTLTAAERSARAKKAGSENKTVHSNDEKVVDQTITFQTRSSSRLDSFIHTVSLQSLRIGGFIALRRR